MSDDTQLTELGNLKPNIAAAACYMPVASINLIASALFLLKEPKEHTFVRFHAAQSLVFTGVYLVGTFLGTFLYIAASVGVSVVAGMFDMGGLAALANLLMLLVFMAVILLPIGVLVGLCAASFLEKDIRLPMISGLATKLAGSPE